MPVISIRSLSKIYSPGLGRGKVVGLESLTMDVEEREVFGFLGPNGAGKTTTIKILTGLMSPTGGTAEVFGQPLGAVEAKRKIGFLPEHPYFYDHLTGREILDYFSRLFGLKSPERGIRINRLLERVGLAHAADLPLRGYSKGMLQRIGIAQALVNDPPLVMLDEPMSGLDPVGRKEVRDLILDLRAEKRTVFFSTHILSDVEVVCDRIAILHKGRLVTLSPLRELVQMAGDQMELIVAGLSDPARTELQAIPGATVAESGGRLVVRIAQEHASRALEVAQKGHGTVLSLAPVRRTLEEIFMDRIGGATPKEGGT